MKLKRLLTPLALAGLMSCGLARADLVTVTNDVIAAEHWYSTNTYLLGTMVYVQSNAVLSIEPGTVIKAGTSNLLGRDGLPNLVAGLWVGRGGKLYATGAVSAPIIMTYDGDNVNDPYDLPFNTSGKWGGLVICGNAQINSAQYASGQAATPKFERFEGLTTDGTNGVHLFGGNDDNDNSGIIRYVSIRYAGNEFAPAKELNGLSMGSVGAGTTIEYVEVLNSSDDGFEFFGGNVNTKHLVAAFCEDDDFDTDQGYRGTNQFWFGIKPTWNGSTDSRGFETDGDLSQTGYPGGNATPVSSWAAYNVTLIGRGQAVSGFGGGRVWNSRDEARPNIFNSVFTEFNQGVLVDSDGINEFDTGVATLKNSIINVASNAASANAAYLTTNSAYANSELNPLLGGVSYTNNLGLNPRPQPGSPALTNVLAGAPTAVSYRGAFAPNDSWADGWTALSSLGFLEPSVPILSIVPNGASVGIAWNSLPGKAYLLQSKATIGGTWVDEGAALMATDATLSTNLPANGAEQYYRIMRQ